MEVDGDEHRQSSDIGALHAQSPSIVQISLVLSDTVASLELPPAFKMAQELTFTMLVHTLWSTRDGPNSYVTILLTFLQPVLWHPEGLATLELVLQQLYEPEPAGAEPARAGPGSSSSRAEPWGVSRTYYLFK